jgi:hypothetical protein
VWLIWRFFGFPKTYMLNALFWFKRGTGLVHKNSGNTKNEECDPEHLQAMDETNEKWVAEWKNASTPKSKSKQ